MVEVITALLDFLDTWDKPEACEADETYNLMMEDLQFVLLKYAVATGYAQRVSE